MKNLASIKILLLCLIGWSSFFTSTHTLHAGAQEVTASDYCDFLNNRASTDEQFFYDQKMSCDPSVGCIARTGALGNYEYFVLAGRENEPISFVNEADEKAYSEWSESRLQEDFISGDDSLKSNARGFEITKISSISDVALASISELSKTSESPFLQDTKKAFAVGFILLSMIQGDPPETPSTAESQVGSRILTEDPQIVEAKVRAKNTAKKASDDNINAEKNAKDRYTMFLETKETSNQPNNMTWHTDVKNWYLNPTRAIQGINIDELKDTTDKENVQLLRNNYILRRDKADESLNAAFQAENELEESYILIPNQIRTAQEAVSSAKRKAKKFKGSVEETINVWNEYNEALKQVKGIWDAFAVTANTSINCWEEAAKDKEAARVAKVEWAKSILTFAECGHGTRPTDNDDYRFTLGSLDGVDQKDAFNLGKIWVGQDYTEDRTNNFLTLYSRDRLRRYRPSSRISHPEANFERRNTIGTRSVELLNGDFRTVDFFDYNGHLHVNYPKDDPSEDIKSTSNGLPRFFRSGNYK